MFWFVSLSLLIDVPHFHLQRYQYNAARHSFGFFDSDEEALHCGRASVRVRVVEGRNLRLIVKKRTHGPGLNNSKTEQASTSATKKKNWKSYIFEDKKEVMLHAI
jgi:hypothetical protein